MNTPSYVLIAQVSHSRSARLSGYPLSERGQTPNENQRLNDSTSEQEWSEHPNVRTVRTSERQNYHIRADVLIRLFLFD
jgi:hypothetical protein